MIISKTPYRIPWSGGGTDHKFYYSLKGGDLISIAIKEYVYVFYQGIILGPSMHRTCVCFDRETDLL